MENLSKKKIHEIVLKNPAVTRVFEELKIDYCCNEVMSIEEACRVAKANPEIVSEKIADALRSNEQPQNFEKLKEKSLTELIDYIVEKHHTFTRDEIGRLTLLIGRILHKHLDKYPELPNLNEVFTALCDNLMPHMRREELVVFPYFKSLETAKIKDRSATAQYLTTVPSPVGVMMLDHEQACELFEEIHRLTSDFTAPQAACPCVKSLYYGLSELDKDFNLHIKLENDLLFPRAFRLEQEALFGY